MYIKHYTHLRHRDTCINEGHDHDKTKGRDNNYFVQLKITFGKKHKIHFCYPLSLLIIISVTGNSHRKLYILLLVMVIDEENSDEIYD